MRAIPTVVLSFLVAAGAPALAHAADLTFHRSLNANGNVSLNVCTNSGNIHVSGVDGNTIQISGKVHSASTWHSFDGFSSPADLKKIADNPPIQQTGNMIRVGNHDTCSGHLFHNVAIDYEISIPRNSTVIADSGSGDVRIESVSGLVHADTGSGGIRVNGIGSGSKLETGSGDIDAQHATGTLQAHTGSGGIQIHDSQISDAQLGTGSGDISAAYIRGSLKADTGSGSVTIFGLPGADWKLETGSGEIRFHADPNAKFTLDASSSSGDINSKLPIVVSGHMQHGALRGPVNGGGPMVKMRTGSGDISLQ
jgi:Putative adhesin